MLKVIIEPKAMLTILELLFFIVVIAQICINPTSKNKKKILRGLTGAYSSFVGLYSIWYIIKYIGEKSALRGILSLFFALSIIINNLILESKNINRKLKVLLTILFSIISFIALVIIEYKIVS